MPGGILKPGVNWLTRVAALAALLGIVYLLGTSLFSAARMERLLYPLLGSWFHITDSAEQFHYLVALRLTAHYLEFFVLSLALVWIVGLRPFAAVIVSLLLAAADEGHQYLLPDRTFALRDLRYDAAGVLTAFVLAVAIRRLRRVRWVR